MKVFLSSTFQDLQDYRQAVFKVVHSLGGYTDDMAYWPASGKEAAMLSTERVGQSDAMILILAHRYGYVPQGNEVSVTELEYRAAREAGIPVYAFFIDEGTPWPPNLIEWEKRENLARFKEQVAREVVFQKFASPEALAVQVAQALALLHRNQVQGDPSKHRFEGRARSIMPPAYLRAKSDVLIRIGEAEDDLPLLLNVKRGGSRDLYAHFGGRDGFPSAVRQSEAFSAFQRSYEELALRVLVENRIKSVLMRNGGKGDLYVTQSTLTSLFGSSFSYIMSSVRSSASADTEVSSSSPPQTQRPRVRPASVAVMGATDQSAPLQSTGGSNRFLGISPADGSLYSVGRQGDEWVEWHPFFLERLLPYFSEATFLLKSVSIGTKVVGVAEYQSALAKIAVDTAHQDGRVPVEVSVELDRQSIGQLILKIGRALVGLHAQGMVHGDLKPSNVILAQGGPELIDHFSLSDGDVSPGWTPDWSAPEQILGEPLSFSADLYPMGRMLSDLLSGFLVGEVRKFRTPPLADGRIEFDIFYNPAPYLADASLVLTSEKNFRHWLSLVKACMRFKPEERPSALEFVERLAGLLTDYPLLGAANISMPANLLAAILPDGHETVARVIKVVEPPLPLPTPFGWLPLPEGSKSDIW